MSKPRDLSRLFTNATDITTDSELISTVASASANTLSAANIYTDSAISSFEALPSQSGNEGKYLSTDGSTTTWEELDLNAAIVSASTAAYASASAYTDSEISNIDLSATIQTASAAAVTYLVDSAPATLDTLNELAQALGDDENFSTTVTNSLAGKLSISSASATYLTQANASATYATKSEIDNSIVRWSKIYSGSATSISGYDDYGNELSYTPGILTVYINGILQDPTNYTASSGSSVILSEPVVLDDSLEIVSYRTIDIANTYTKEEIDSKLSTRIRWVKTLSSSATVISGTDDNGTVLSYNVGSEQVFLNGILIKKNTDYATTSTSTITLVEEALSGDTVEIINFLPINVADVYTQTQSDAKYLTPASASATYLTIAASESLDTLPSQTGNSGKYLTTNGASASWQEIVTDPIPSIFLLGGL